MEIKLLKQAIEFSPERVAEFIINLYSESDTSHKAQIDAKFDRLFNSEGSGSLDDESSNLRLKT